MKTFPILPLLVLSLLASACQLQATDTSASVEPAYRWEDFSWTWTYLGGNPPTPLRGMQTVYDSARQSIVLFGGTAGQPLAETWEYDGANWLRISTTATPPARFWHGMAYNSERQVTMLFGGTASETAGDLLNDTWQYDGMNWLRVTTLHSPPPRGRGALLVFDSCRGKLILFGGQTPSGLSTSTWEYDGSDWMEILLPATPPGRFLAGMVFDPQRCKAVLFGGGGESQAYNDTWEYDGTGWTQVQTAHAPEERWAHAMAFEPSTGTILLFGGYEPGDNSTANDTWRYNGLDWQQVATHHSAVPIEQASLAWDGGNRQMILLGAGFQWVLESYTGTPPTAAVRTSTPRTITVNPTSTPRPTSIPTVPGTPGCDDGFSRLQAGEFAILTPGELPNRVRSAPLDEENNILSLLYPGTTVRVLGGPVCHAGLVFWKVASETIPGGVGWTAEGDGSVYYLEPYQP